MTGQAVLSFFFLVFVVLLHRQRQGAEGDDGTESGLEKVGHLVLPAFVGLVQLIRRGGSRRGGQTDPDVLLPVDVVLRVG